MADFEYLFVAAPRRAYRPSFRNGRRLRGSTPAEVEVCAALPFPVTGLSLDGSIRIASQRKRQRE